MTRPGVFTVVVVAALFLAASAAVTGCLIIEPFPDLAPDPGCGPRFADCNGDPRDGCEVSLDVGRSTTDSFGRLLLSDCGACNAYCVGMNAKAISCSAGACSFTCDPGFAACNGDPHAGCETYTSIDVGNCGACGKRCGSGDPSRDQGQCVDGDCHLRCVGSFTNCDGDVANGCEVDVMHDPRNCGTCGRSCEGECGGHCLPLTLASVQSAPAEIVLGPEYVYFQGSSGVGKVGRSGGVVSAMATSNSQTRPTALTVDSKNLYWFDSARGEIQRAPLPEGGATKVVVGSQSVVSMAADDGGLFWSDSASKEIRALDGTTYRKVASSPGGSAVGKLLIDEANVYFVVPPLHQVFKVSRNGGAPTLLFDAFNPFVIDAMALDATTLYVAKSYAVGASIWSVGKDGSGSAQLYSIPRTPSLVTDGTWLFHTSPSEGFVYQASIAGATGELLLAESLASPHALAMDAKSVYWTNLGSGPDTGTVMKLEKER